MTAPVQMTGSANYAVAEPRASRRNAAARSGDEVSSGDETSLAENSSAPVSTDDGDSADTPSFSDVLQKLFVPVGTGPRQSHSVKIPASSQKSGESDPNLLATAPVQSNEKAPEVRPLTLSIALPASAPEQPEPSSANVSSTPDHAVPTRGGLSHPSLETMLPVASVSMLPPGSNKTDQTDQTNQSGTTPSSSSPTQAAAQLLQTAAAPEPNQPAGPPAPAAPAPEALAFAAKLTPQGPEDTSVKPPENTSTRSLTTPAAPNVQKPTAAADSAPVPAADTSSERVAAFNVTPLPTHATDRSETAPSPAKSEARPVFAPAVAHTEPASSPPAPTSGSNRDFTVRIPDATDRGTNVRFVDRGSEVHVSVRTSDADLAQMLRGGLNDLTSRLQHSGVQTEVWRPGSNAQQNDSHNAAQGDSSDPKGSGGGRRHQSGAQRDGQDQPPENKPRWVEELEASFEPAAAKTY